MLPSDHEKLYRGKRISGMEWTIQRGCGTKYGSCACRRKWGAVVRIDARYRDGLLFVEKDPHLQAHLIPDNVTVGIADPVKADEG